MKQFGLSRKERITSASDFEHIYKKGAVKNSAETLSAARLPMRGQVPSTAQAGAIAKSGCLVVRSLSNNLGYSRLGIAVSKKSFPKSVTRNRIKRLVREAFRLNKYQLPKGIDLVVGALPKGPKMLTLEEITSSLIATFIKSL